MGVGFRGNWVSIQNVYWLSSYISSFEDKKGWNFTVVWGCVLTKSAYFEGIWVEFSEIKVWIHDVDCDPTWVFFNFLGQKGWKFNIVWGCVLTKSVSLSFKGSVISFFCN